MKLESMPPIRFFRSLPHGPIPMDHAGMEAPLPLARPSTDRAALPGMTYRLYFRAIEFALKSRWELFMKALKDQGSLRDRAPESVLVIAEKHGSDYHPARIKAVDSGPEVSFVMNVALTERGRERMRREFGVLEHLCRSFPRRFVPKGYFFVDEPLPIGGPALQYVTMFMGEWFEGYHEFHLSVDPATSDLVPLLWDMDAGYRFLEDYESEPAFRQAAFILTYYYDMDTFREIFPWHHAAGDFVIKSENGKIDVKLITARQYAARTTFAAQSPENRLQALLLFLANLTLRMRLDRLDGAGDMAWAGEACLKAAIRGFIDGMRAKRGEGRCDPALFERFLDIIARMSPVGWAEVFREVWESYDPDAPDVPVIRERLQDHVFQVYSIAQSFLCTT